MLIGMLAVWYVSTSIKPDQLVQWIGSTVKAETGRDLKVAGPVSLRFFPSIGIAAERVSLSNAPWVSNSEMLRVKRMELDIELLPLLRGEVVFNAINLAGVDAVFQTNRAGDGNWDFELPPTITVNANIPPQSIPSSQAAAQIDPVRIKNIHVAGANIQYQAFGSTPKLFQLSKLSLVGSSNKISISGQL